LASLEIGQNTASKVAIKAKLNRVTTYDIIEKLVKKGLITSHIKAKVKFFTAISPEIIIKNYKLKIQDFEQALPQLKQLNSEVKFQEIRYFEGEKAIENLLQETLDVTEIYTYVNPEQIEKYLKDFIQHYNEIRNEKEIVVKSIVPNNIYGQEYKTKNLDTQLIDKDKYSFESQIIIFGNKVATISFSEKITGTIIEDDQLVRTYKQVFMLNYDLLSSSVSISSQQQQRQQNQIKKQVSEVKVLKDQIQLF